MEWQAALALITLALTSLVLIFLFSATLYKVYMGTQYNIIMWLSALLLVANIGYFIEALGYWVGDVEPNMLD